MKVMLTIPGAGAGKWCWTGWANAFRALGHEVVSNLEQNPDLLITSTSMASQQFLDWRKKNPSAKVALNVLAWTDADLPGINNDGVQASENNVQYAKSLKPNIVFAQYTPKYNETLLSKWQNEGFKLGSMEMAADSTVYSAHTDINDSSIISKNKLFYVGGYWAYKAQNINKYLVPVINKHFDRTVIIGRGWPIRTYSIDNERIVGYNFKAADVCPNIHEPHSTNGGFDVVERVFKTIYCGGLCVSDYVEEMFDGFGFINNQHLIACKSPEEYMYSIEDALYNPQKYVQMRIDGQKFVSENHTYIHRVQKLLKDIE